MRHSEVMFVHLGVAESSLWLSVSAVHDVAVKVGSAKPAFPKAPESDTSGWEFSFGGTGSPLRRFFSAPASKTATDAGLPMTANIDPPEGNQASTQIDGFTYQVRKTPTVYPERMVRL